MVGGIVIEVIDLGNRLWVNCRGTGSEHRDTCAVYCGKPEAKLGTGVMVGDNFWWQVGYCYWTPFFSKQHDIKLDKLSGSGVKRPAGYPIAPENCVQIHMTVQ